MSATADVTDLIPDPVPRALGREFMQAAERDNERTLKRFVDAGFPINYQDPLTGESALHACAGTRAHTVLRYLVGTGKVDYLLRDKGGRLASELAYLFGDDPAAARLLGSKERKQAETQGITLTRRPNISP
ncbi:MAG: ankyrin repeat domain-containing protein [Thiobacillaceae bacterium]